MPRQRKQPKPLPSFPNFLKLPLEIQDEIWKHALDTDVPSAHIVAFDYTLDFNFELSSKLDEAASAELYMRPLTATGRGCSRIKPVLPFHRSLMQTCQRSRQAVERTSRKWERQSQPGPLDYTDIVSIPGTFHSETSMKTARPGQKIYTSRDLFILYDAWNIGKISESLRLRWKCKSKIPLKYVAIPYSPIDWWWSTVDGLNRSVVAEMFRVFDELRVLYFLIEPEIIRKGERLEILSLLPQMKRHLDKYKRTSKETIPKRFQHRDRVYHEISEVLLLKLDQLRGLPRAVTDLEKIAQEQREKDGGDKPPLIIRFMTW